ARQDRLSQSQSAETWKGPGWTWRRDRRRHRVLEVLLGACVNRRVLLRARARLRDLNAGRQRVSGEAVEEALMRVRRGDPLAKPRRACGLGARLSQRARRHLAPQL